MTIKQRIKKLEVNQHGEPYVIPDGYLRDFFIERGVEPVIYPRDPDDALRDMQAAWRKKDDKTKT